MADDKAPNRIVKRDVKPPDSRYRRAASTRELCKTAGSRPGPGAPLGNRNSLVHGIYADRFMSAEERPLFETIIGNLYQDFVFNKSSDFMQVELVAVYFLKLGRAYAIGDWEAAEKLDRMIRLHLKDLKATKIARERDTAQGPATTPAEWATALVEKLAGSRKKSPRKTAAGRKTQK